MMMSAEAVTPTYPDLKGKRVLVTGGSSGIGKATAFAFSKNEAIVMILARTVSKMEAVVADLPTKGYFVSADLRKPDDLERAVGEAVEKMGGIDILINNGTTTNEDFVNPNDVLVLKHLLDIHVIGAMTLMNACKDELIKNSGCVINVSSTYSVVLSEGTTPYNIAKASQDALTRNMAMVWAAQGVRVNSINPGVVDTELWGRMAQKVGVTKQQALDMLSNKHATGNYSQAFEQANAILFLSSKSNSSNITGNMLFTDGGLRLTSWANLGLQPITNGTTEQNGVSQ
eukprot:TRINITY_DN3232_c0_g1_i5.p1 TRINITY_DN3232_c0_g1~~TRINITY_DN3232_c0_g1_i5.p1  ORF type:complete len:286 (-),score=48.83 TRINITY_DN3232_c0_g1_i5:705-1562(-)